MYCDSCAMLQTEMAAVRAKLKAAEETIKAEAQIRMGLFNAKESTLVKLKAVEAELAKYTTHDHAPCMYCDPLRSKLAEAEAECERLREKLAYWRNEWADGKDVGQLEQRNAALVETLTRVHAAILQRDWEYVLIKAVGDIETALGKATDVAGKS